jgi:hypothetical protein|nr:MAG TPA: hypothetical protein [Caudoviricetes sp.]
MSKVRHAVEWLKRDKLLKALSVAMIFSLAFSGYTLFKSLTLQPGQSVTISGGVKVEKPVTSITNAQVDKNGNLVVYYSDGEARNVGSVIGTSGKDGADGRAPTATEIAVAVKAYCITNQCSESPTSAQVSAAVASYCASGNCKGGDGKNASDEQVAAAVARYCANGKCKGETGATGATGAAGLSGLNGANGTDGQSPVLACVDVKDNSGNQTSWIAWKYPSEQNGAYRRLYKIDHQPNCITI